MFLYYLKEDTLNTKTKILIDYLTRYKFILKKLKGKNKVKMLYTLRDIFIKMLEDYIIYINTVVI
jgi:hypothetical protein